MASAQFKKTFAVRFISYFLMLTGFLVTILQFGPTVAAEFNYRKDQLFGVKYTIASTPTIVTSNGQIQDTNTPNPDAQNSTGFGNISQTAENIIQPVSTDYGLVIEKINANARVIANVDSGVEAEYTKALQEGVAEAKGSTKPGEPGNLFLFSHSTDAPWNVSRYNAIFYLLRELVPGDRVLVFYQGRRYDYIVYDKTITKPEDISFLTNRYDKPVLTLQTCDPPGTTLNRLIVRAKLANS